MDVFGDASFLGRKAREGKGGGAHLGILVLSTKQACQHANKGHTVHQVVTFFKTLALLRCFNLKLEHPFEIKSRYFGGCQG